MSISIVDTKSNNGNGSTLNVQNVLVSNFKRVLYVFVTMENFGLESTLSVKWMSGGSEQDFGSAIATIANNEDAQVEVFRLIAPTVGTDTIYCTFDAAVTDGVAVGVVSLSGVDQTTPNGTVATNIGNDASPTIDITSGGTDELVIAALANEYATVISVDSPAVELWNEEYSSHFSVGARNVGASGTVTINWTGDGSGPHWAIAGFSINPSATYKLEGVTKDQYGVALGSCKCFLFKDNGDNTLTFIDYVLSNAVTGEYSFTDLLDNSADLLVAVWKDDSPHVFGVGDHVLQPVAE